MKNTEKDLNIEVTTSVELNKMLTGLLKEKRRGEVDYDTAKSIASVADKINKNNTNALVYKRLTMHRKPIEFFQDDLDRCSNSDNSDDSKKSKKQKR